MEVKTKNYNAIRTKQGNATVFILAILILLALMIGSIFFTGPSGQTITTSSFVQLWLRELIIVGILVVAIIVVGINWLRKSVKNREHH